MSYVMLVFISESKNCSIRNHGELGSGITNHSSGQTIVSQEDSEIPKQQFDQQNQRCNYEPSQYSTKFEPGTKLDSECVQKFQPNYQTECDTSYETKCSSDHNLLCDSTSERESDAVSHSTRDRQAGFYSEISKPERFTDGVSLNNQQRAMKDYNNLPSNIDYKKCE